MVRLAETYEVVRDGEAVWTASHMHNWERDSASVADGDAKVETRVVAWSAPANLASLRMMFWLEYEEGHFSAYLPTQD